EAAAADRGVQPQLPQLRQRPGRHPAGASGPASRAACRACDNVLTPPTGGAAPGRRTRRRPGGVRRGRWASRVGSAVGEMAEWFKAPVLKTGEGSNLPWVRIPLSPPILPVLLGFPQGSDGKPA